MTLGDTIKLLRTEQGLTQPELAERARIEQSYLSKLENDKGTPSFDIINRIAQALGLTGMGLIHKLSHSYISENLSHLPEVAAEYASVKERREQKRARRMLGASALMVLGLTVFLTGKTQLLASDWNWYYRSEGVILPGEHFREFSDGFIQQIAETTEETRARLLRNRGRVELDYLVSNKNLGTDFVKTVEGGQRYYQLQTTQSAPNTVNLVLEILGAASSLAGFLFAVYNLGRALEK